MKKNGRTDERIVSNIIKSLLLSLLAGTLFCAVLLVAFSWMIVSSHTLPFSFVSVIILIILVLSSVLCGFCAAKGVGKRGLFMGIASGFLFFLLLLLASCIFSVNCSFSDWLFRLPVILLAASLGGYIGTMPKKVKSRR